VRMLLLGASGQVGWELRRSLAALGPLVAVDRTSEPRSDLNDPDRVIRFAYDIRPEVIINAAAYTAVDRAEDDQQAAWRVNAEAPKALAAAAEAMGSLFVHFSTDYVFSGLGDRPWTEDSSVGPINAYGRSKLAGEEGVRTSCRRHLIFRTSWVYASRGSNFLRRILALASEREVLSVVDDQVGSPTGAELIADVVSMAVREERRSRNGAEIRGTYHLVARGSVSWHRYATHAIEVARRIAPGWACRAERIDAVTSDHFPVKARRPLNSRLEPSKVERDLGLTLPPWEAGVNRAIAELLGVSQ
jgi:dTDP-4-dehydrorhamnose reductase